MPEPVAISALDQMTAEQTAADDLFVIVDVSADRTKCITRAELLELFGGDVAWDDLEGVPETFPPEAHTHAQSEVTGLVSALAGKAAASHTHAIADTTGLQAALDGKAATSHTHAEADVTGLTAALAGKAASVHAHAIADVTGLQTALDGKAAASHTHAIADTTGLQAALDGKQASNANLTALAGQTGAADRISYWTAAATLALAVFTSFGRTLLALADLDALKTLLGLGSAAYVNTNTFAAASHDHDAAAITSGTLDPARIPILFSGVQVVSSGAIADLDAGQQTTVTAGAIVTTTDGRRWIYKGSGSKTSEASYIESADVTPDWSVIANKPSFATVATSGAYSDLSGKPTLGTAAALDVGTTANKVLQLTAAGKLPAVDGSLLTNLPGGGGGVQTAPATAAANTITPTDDVVPLTIDVADGQTEDLQQWKVDGVEKASIDSAGNVSAVSFIASANVQLGTGGEVQIGGDLSLLRESAGVARFNTSGSVPANLRVTQLLCDASSGTPPLVVAGSARCVNLNADLLDGKELAAIESDYTTAISTEATARDSAITAAITAEATARDSAIATAVAAEATARDAAIAAALSNYLQTSGLGAALAGLGGASSSGAFTNFTISNGLVTSAS